MNVDRTVWKSHSNTHRTRRGPTSMTGCLNGRSTTRYQHYLRPVCTGVVFTRDLILIRVFYVIVGRYVDSILNEKNANAIYRFSGDF